MKPWALCSSPRDNALADFPIFMDSNLKLVKKRFGFHIDNEFHDDGKAFNEEPKLYS